jgi:hypothetical protein
MTLGKVHVYQCGKDACDSQQLSKAFLDVNGVCRANLESNATLNKHEW